MNQNTNYIFKEENIDWAKLESVGIRREQLEKDGNLDLLLQGKETGLIPIHLQTPVINLTLDATLSLTTDENGKTIVEISSIQPIK